MRRPYRAPMPERLRHALRAGQHPARSVACPWCQARPHEACTLRTRPTPMPGLHPIRMAAWARQTAACEHCGAVVDAPCHDNGIARQTVHAQRYTAAEETLA